MIDTATKKRLQVSTDGDAGPYLLLPLDQLPAVERLLSQNGVRYWVEENAVSIDDEPLIAAIEFGRRGDTAMIQKLLDEHA